MLQKKLLFKAIDVRLRLLEKSLPKISGKEIAEYRLHNALLSTMHSREAIERYVPKTLTEWGTSETAAAYALTKNTIKLVDLIYSAPIELAEDVGAFLRGYCWRVVDCFPIR